MQPDVQIRVGLLTDGVPRMSETAEGTRIENLLIGAGFHWQRTVSGTFAGRIEMLQEPQGAIHAVNVVDIEDYVKSVIGSEMNPEAPVELLKAHAVISRSWAMRKLEGARKGAGESGRYRMTREGERLWRVTGWEESGSHSGFDVCNDDHCQRYQGICPLSPTTAAAIEETRGVVLRDVNGEIADTRFSKCCGGMTEVFSTCWGDEEKGYLTARTDPWCDLSDMAPGEREEMLRRSLKGYDAGTDFRDWTANVPAKELRERIRTLYGIDCGEIGALRPVSRGASGRIKELLIEGSESSLLIGKTLAIRRLLAADCLKSSWFEVESEEGGFLLQGRGWGHGVGLCQIGAARMAWEGRTYAEILSAYFRL